MLMLSGYSWIGIETFSLYTMHHFVLLVQEGNHAAAETSSFYTTDKFEFLLRKPQALHFKQLPMYWVSGLQHLAHSTYFRMKSFNKSCNFVVACTPLRRNLSFFKSKFDCVPSLRPKYLSIDDGGRLRALPTSLIFVMIVFLPSICKINLGILYR